MTVVESRGILNLPLELSSGSCVHLQPIIRSAHTMIHQAIPTTSQQVRRQNRYAILHALRAAQAASKATLARTLRISPATVGSVIEGLRAEDLVVEKGAGPSTGGRRPQLLTLNPVAPLTIGVDLGGTKLTILVLNMRGDVLDRVTHSFPLDGGTVDAHAIGALVRPVVERWRGQGCAGAGLAVPGLLSMDEGVVRYSANLGWRNLPLRAMLAEQLHLPVLIERNTNASLLAEEWWGDVDAAEPALFVTLGSGIGAALQVDGRFLRGASATFGELGHIPIAPDGPLCRCGQRGCLEAMASATAVETAYAALLGESNTGPHVPLATIIARADAGETAALAVLHKVADYLGAGMTILVNLLNPGLIILGGELMEAAAILLPRIQAAVADHALAIPQKAVNILPSTLRGDAAAMGAASLVVDACFAGAWPYQPEKEALMV